MNVNVVMTEDAPVIDNHQNFLINQLEGVPQSACKSLVLNGNLGYLTDMQFKTVLTKIRKGGVISITASDVMEIATALCWGKIDVNTFSSLTSNMHKQYCLMDIKNILEHNGYVVETASIQDLVFHIRAKRP